MEDRPHTRTFLLSNLSPGFPSTTNVVLTVSIGAMIILNKVAHNEAKTVLTGDGSQPVEVFDPRRASMPTFAAVSPKRARVLYVKAIGMLR